jgi:hypothetical protein
MNNRARAGFVTVVVVLAGACGGGSGESGDASPAVTAAEPAPTQSAGEDQLVVDGELNVDVLDAVVGEFEALDAAQQQERINELSVEVERQLYELSGLAEALGSSDAVEVSITESAQWLAGLADDVTASIESAELEPQGIRGNGVAQQGTPSIAAGLAGALIVTYQAGEAAVSATNDGVLVDGELGTGVRIKSTKDTAELSTASESTDSAGVRTTLTTRNVVTPCPAPDGTFEASASIDTSSTINNGLTGKRITFEVTVNGTVDDNAALVGYDVTSAVEYADFVDGTGRSLDLTFTVPRDGKATATFAGSGSDEDISSTSSLNAIVSILAGIRLTDAARIGWESGRCVDLKPTVSAGPTGLAPSASVTITAAPRSKIDGTPVGGTVTALLTGGEAAVEPSSTPLPADAEFTYTAPGENDKTGTVALEARSKRGVGKATINFDTKAAYAYQIVGGLDDFQTNTAVCDVLAPFTLSGGGITVDFSGGLTGTYTYTGVFSAAGGGEYMITLPDGPGQPGTMIGGGEGSVEGGFSATGTENYTLTPIKC